MCVKSEKIKKKMCFFLFKALIACNVEIVIAEVENTTRRTCRT